MSEPLPGPHLVAKSPLGRLIEWACAAMAILGSALFLTEAVMSVVSVAGRSVLSKPVLGDYELVQLASAMGIVMCLPYCQLKRGHVFVDFFTLWAPTRLKKLFDALACLVLAGIAFLLAWRCWLGLVDMREYEESSMVLGLPIWWGYIPMTPAFILLGITCLMTMVQDLRASATEVAQ
ncbi:TRAP transporter small permease [Pusillimonas sp. CC-YST705]|uniref:TRAP transporter small permease protein n=1 Tax=Mesopusillimonas faecipullorum TaxID=2755040 RepID=A0ABS8C961_9BURK|nr:TRAP transporter small permease [Mesopusillimonas faecipullorum]MCB5362570.1 TRAP transporter small permease [Mesopusillimonas faecipullorum]